MIHATAEVSPDAHIGPGTRIWHGAQVREGAVIGEGCTIGKNAYVDAQVRLGSNVKVQNNASLFHPAVLEDGVFVGPHAIVTNDKVPRAINPDGSLKSAADWEARGTRVCYGASIGAGAIVLPGLTIGRWALIGAGAVVTRDVPERAIVVGNPGRITGYACDCGRALDPATGRCPSCGRSFPTVP